MKRIIALSLVLAFGLMLTVSGAAHAASFTGRYEQNFDSLGTSGKPALPDGWSIWWANFSTGASAATYWQTAIPATNVRSMSLSPTSTTNYQNALTSIGYMSITTNMDNMQGWNNIATSATSTDRVISTAPTTTPGLAFQLELTNNSAAALNNIIVSYDVVKFYNGNQRTSPYVESLPGYQLFYAIGSTAGTWTNVAALNLTTAEMPVGTLGQKEYYVYSITNQVIALNQSWDIGENLYLRWVDDNASGLSPDQFIGLNNVVVTPIPAAAWLLGTGLIGLVVVRRRMKK